MVHKKSTHKNIHHNAGFTLIEVLVSMSIFTIVVGMAVGTMVVLIDANAKAQNVQQAASNVAFALDSMSREIRTGIFYYGDTDGNPVSSGSAVRDCSSATNCDTISFVEAGDSLTGSCTGGTGGGRVAYRHNNEALERRLCDGDWQPMTSPEVTIDHAQFIVEHTARDDSRSPVVIIYVEATVDGVIGTAASLRLQSSITQQAIDI